MLTIRSRCFGTSCLWNFHPKPMTRTFLTATHPAPAGLRPTLSKAALEESSQPPDANTSPFKRVNHRQPRGLFRALGRSIYSSKDQELVASRVNSNLDIFIPHILHPHSVYEDVIRFLLGRNRLLAAVKVYERMTAEGLITSPSVEAQLLVTAIPLVENRLRNRLFQSLKTVIRNAAFTADNLLSVLGKIVEADLPPQLLLEVTAVFDRSHKAMRAFEFDINFFKHLIYAGAESGDSQLVLDALATLPHSEVDQKLIPEIYASFFTAVRRSARPSRALVLAAMDQMEQQGIHANLFVWNALIAYEVRSNSLHRPFTIYEALKTQTELLPDDYTFGSLFNVLNRFYSPKRRKFRHGQRLPDTIPTPRTLYREMVRALVRDPQAPPFKLTTSLLNSALRYFIFKKDYAGAYVVVKSFHAFHIPVNVRTYFIVYRHLMNRITYGIRAFRKMGSVTWADRFLSLPYPIHDPAILSHLQLSNRLASHILNASKQHLFRLNGPLYIALHTREEMEEGKYQTPTVQEMLGHKVVPLDQEFDVVPLERLLKKALLAEVGSTQDLNQGQPPSSVLSGTITQARAEMRPPGLGGQLKKMRVKIRKLASRGGASNE